MSARPEDFARGMLGGEVDDLSMLEFLKKMAMRGRDEAGAEPITPPSLSGPSYPGASFDRSMAERGARKPMDTLFQDILPLAPSMLGALAPAAGATAAAPARGWSSAENAMRAEKPAFGPTARPLARGGPMGMHRTEVVPYDRMDTHVPGGRPQEPTYSYFKDGPSAPPPPPARAPRTIVPKMDLADATIRESVPTEVGTNPSSDVLQNMPVQNPPPGRTAPPREYTPVMPREMSGSQSLGGQVQPGTVNMRPPSASEAPTPVTPGAAPDVLTELMNAPPPPQISPSLWASLRPDERFALVSMLIAGTAGGIGLGHALVRGGNAPVGPPPPQPPPLPRAEPHRLTRTPPRRYAP